MRFSSLAPSGKPNVKQDMETRLSSLHDTYQQAVAGLNVKLTNLDSSVQRLVNDRNLMTTNLNSAYNDTFDILRITSDLKQKHMDNGHKQALVDAFLKRYTLSDDQVKYLTATTINNDFFEALEHLQQVLKDCTLLLTTDHRDAG